MFRHDSRLETHRGDSFWLDCPPGPVKRFGYLRDRLFLLSTFLYALNRWLIKPHVHSPFLRFHFNDLLLIPCALPPMLLIQHWLRLRRHDEPPLAREIIFHLVVWSILFEVIGPHFVRRATGDAWDVVSYFCGAIIAWAWWHRQELVRRLSVNEL